MKLGAERGNSLGRGERGLVGQPLRSATFRGGVAFPSSLALLFPLLPLCLFVSDFFFSCLSPQPPSFNPLLLRSGNKCLEYLLSHSSPPPAHLGSPDPRGQDGRSDYGVQSCPSHVIIFPFIFLLSLLKLSLRSFPVSHTPLVAANLLRIGDTERLTADAMGEGIVEQMGVSGP